MSIRGRAPGPAPTAKIPGRFERMRSTSVAVLLAGLVSVKPGGTPTVAVLVNGPGTPALRVSVKVTLPPTGKLTVVWMAPVPLAWATVAPPAVTAVQEAAM